jgi:hypothetical protein
LNIFFISMCCTCRFRNILCVISERPRTVPSSASDGSGEPTRHVCVVCKELLPDEQGLADHVGVAHVERQNTGGRRLDG